MSIQNVVETNEADEPMPDSLIELQAEKDSEIAQLKAKVEAAGRVELREQWERMQRENLALKDLVTAKNQLITELCDALDRYTPDAEGGYREAKALIRRAREAQ